MDLRTEYENYYGKDAPVMMCMDLMRGDEATCKQGYSAENALLAVFDLFGITDDAERSRIRLRVTSR